MIDRATLLTGGLAAVMLVAAVLLITTTIRLSALSRRRETGIMRLVGGASTMFIQLPFMLEGAIAATVGSLMAVGGLWLGVQYLVTDWLGGTVSWIPYVTTSDVLTVAPLLVAAGILLAAISSLVTLSRYTKV